MYLYPADAKKYEKLAHYMSKSFQECYKEPSIAYALKKVGGLSMPKLRLALRWGQMPYVRVTNLVGAYGEFTPDRKSNEIRIDRQVAVDFEAGRGIRRAAAGKVYLAGVTMLHELIHWCDDQDGVDRPGEEGEEFERLVYGSVIN
jgi:hypothetical protein